MKYEINGHIVEAEAELSEAEIDEIAASFGSQPSSNPPADTMLNKAAAFSEKAQAATLGQVAQLGQKAALGLARVATGSDVAGNAMLKGANAAMGLIPKAEGAAAEWLGKVGVNPYVAATGVTVGSQLAQAALMPFGRGKAISKTVGPFGVATAPAERQAAVAAAQEMGVPLTRAEITGGRMAGAVESGLEKTLTGGQPIADFRMLQQKAIEEAFNKAKATYGSADAPLAAGMNAKDALLKNKAAASTTSRGLYANIPDQFNVPLNSTVSQADSIIQKYSQFPEEARQSSVVKMAGDVQNAAQALSEGKNNWGYVQELRSTLGSKIKMAKRTGDDKAVLEYTQLKMALDNDINTFINTPAAPQAELMKKALKENFSKANTYHRAYKELFKDNRTVKRLLDDKTRVEEYPEIIFGGGRVEDVLVAKSALGRDGFDVVKRQWLNELLSSKNLGEAVNKYDPSFLRTVLNGQERQHISKLVDVKKITLAAEKMGGTYGSSRVNTGRANAGAVGAGLTMAGMSALSLNPMGVAVGLGTAGAAYFGPKVAASQYLKRGVKGVDVNIPITSGSSAPRRGATLAAIRSYLQNQGSQQ
jgi:hypothetical protein